MPNSIFSRCLVTLLAPGLAACGLLAQAAPASPKVQIHKRVGEVMVDLVVTDAHGKIIKNLKPGQLQVLDDNQLQTVASFHRVAASVHLTRADLLQAGLPPELRPQPFNLIVLVFDRMGNAGRVLAKQTADKFIENDLGPRDYVAVYDINKILYALQNFTTNKAALLKAVATASGGSARAFRHLSLSGQQLMLQARQEEQAATQALSGVGRGQPSTAAAGSLAEAKMNEMIARGLQGAAAMKGEQQSWATLTALESIVNGLQSLPGRKELVYFSQYLAVNSNTGFVYRNLMRDANRASVSFYPVDPHGLSLTSSASDVRNSLNYAAGVSQQSTMSAGRGGVSSAEAHEFESISNVKYAGRLTTMQTLASATGGFLAAHTNDLSPFMQELAGDISSHYELTYAPPNGLNGAYHVITIRVLGHPDWIVRARKGYYALPSLGREVRPYELPVLPLLSQTPPPANLALESRAMQFPQNPRLPMVDFMTRVPLADLNPLPATPAQTQANPALAGKQVVHFVVLQQIRDAAGNVVRQFSHEYEFDAPPANMAGLLHRNLIFSRRAFLLPGSYTVRTALYQPSPDKASVLSEPLKVPAAGPGQLRVSSIVVIQDAVARQPGAKDQNDPLNYQNKHLDPNLSHAMPAAASGKMIGFYFLAYVPKGLPPAQLTMNFSSAGVPMASPTAPLPAPDAQGRIAYIANLPAAAFPPGQYQLNIQVKAGTQIASRTTQFAVVAPSAAAPVTQ